MAVPKRIFQNIRVYWITFIAYCGIFLLGYDTGIAGGVVSQAFFQKHFGLVHADGTIDTNRSNDVSSNVVSVLQAGAFFGALGSAPISARIGRKWTLIGFSAISSVGAILTTLAGSAKHGLGLIYAGRVISGFGVGGISAVAPAYVSECSPKAVRGRIMGIFQIMVAIGFSTSYFINFGVSQNEKMKNSTDVWRLPFGFQLVPCGIMLLGLFTITESPRWLASVGRHEEAIRNLAYLRKEREDSGSVLHEMLEIRSAIEEERVSREVLGFKNALFGRGNFSRFVIAFGIFLLQQWGGQNSVGYYAPLIFSSIGYTGAKNSLLASGIYSIVKVIATAFFVFFLADSLGRKMSLFISAIGMGVLSFIIGAVLKTHPPPKILPGKNISPPPASKGMAAMLYIYVVFYSMGWGPLPWVYVSDIFPTRTRHYGLALASASQWLFSFVVSKVTPTLISHLGFKIFLMFGAINILAMGAFSLVIPETKGRSLEEMDIIFGAISAEERQAHITKQENDYEKRHTTSRVSLSVEKG